MRVDGRESGDLRPLTITTDYLKTADGSAVVELGDTKVLCAVTIESKVPPHRLGSGSGWLTAEYDMLPRSSNVRIPRDRSRGMPGRSHEIQRLIGRALRAIFDMDKFGERQIIVDCDVIQADGGTRSAAITGGFVALAWAVRRLVEAKQAKTGLIRDFVAGTSVGIVEGLPALDLCYLEDAQADVDMNVAMTGAGNLIEVQGTAEGAPFSRAQLDELMSLAASGIEKTVAAQREALGVEDISTV
jgi:ribonuclease PH